MKKLDKAIIIYISSLMIWLSVIGFIHDYSIALKTISVLLGIVYACFVIAHIFMAMPLIIIHLFIDDLLNSSVFIKEVKKASNILYNTIYLATFGCVAYVVYFVLPIAIAMLYNNSIDIDKALILLDNIIV